MAQTVFTEQQGRVLTVRLLDPPRTFMTGGMVRELDALTRRLEEDRSVGAVVITGGLEGVFITHFDVAEILAGAGGPTVSAAQAGIGLRTVAALERVPGAERIVEGTPTAAGLAALRRMHEMLLRLGRLDKVVVAAINGLALGGGCELALACDLRLMAEGDGRIGLPETTLGIIPGAGGTQRLARALGPAKALELMLEGRALTSDEAVDAGLVHRSVPAADLLAEAQATAERLARRSPTAIRALKTAVYDGGSRRLEDGLRIEQAGFLAAATSPAARTAMRRYVDDVERLGDIAPDQAVTELARWQQGEVVDMTGG